MAVFKINEKPEKITLVDEDLYLLGDSEDLTGIDYNLKKTKLSSLTTYLQGSLVFSGVALENLVIKNNSTNPSFQLDIDWDALSIGSFVETSFSQTIDITVDIDTGTEANSTLYYVYAIAGDGETTKCLFSTSATSPTLPAGYTESRFISLVYNKSAGDFVLFLQNNQEYTSDMVLSVFNGTVNTTIDIDLTTSGVIPVLNRADKLYSYCVLQNNVNPTYVEILTKSGSSYLVNTVIYDRDNIGGITVQLLIPYVSTTIGIQNTGSGAPDAEIIVSGFQLKI